MAEKKKKKGRPARQRKDLPDGKSYIDALEKDVKQKKREYFLEKYPFYEKENLRIVISNQY
jgi:hypothetical protein